MERMVEYADRQMEINELYIWDLEPERERERERENERHVLHV